MLRGGVKCEHASENITFSIAISFSELNLI